LYLLHKKLTFFLSVAQASRLARAHTSLPARPLPRRGKAISLLPIYIKVRKSTVEGRRAGRTFSTKGIIAQFLGGSQGGEKSNYIFLDMMSIYNLILYNSAVE
jgi:hypothetical protein